MRPEHTHEYETYLRSPRWKKFRHEIIEYRAFRCQDCLTLGSFYTLQVHHLNYERLGKELPSDVLVLCSTCHEKADNERKEAVRMKNDQALYRARLDGWARKVYGDNWADWRDYSAVRHEFEDWLEDHEE